MNPCVRITVVVALAGALACSKSTTPTPEPATQPVPPMPIDIPPHTGPDSPFAVPGWLAFTVRPADRRSHPWTPAHPNATVAILDAEPWSEAVEEGTPYRLVAREGNLPLTLSEVSQIPYGCDGTPLTMAAFKTPHDLAEQAAWILPEGHDKATAIAVKPGAATATRRSWTLGPLTVIAETTSARKGVMRITGPGDAVFDQAFVKPELEGAQAGDLDLQNDMEIGVPVPVAAFQLDDTVTAVVVRTLGYETVTFEVVALAGDLRSTGKQSIYLCAN